MSLRTSFVLALIYSLLFPLPLYAKIVINDKDKLEQLFVTIEEREDLRFDDKRMFLLKIRNSTPSPLRLVNLTLSFPELDPQPTLISREEYGRALPAFKADEEWREIPVTVAKFTLKTVAVLSLIALPFYVISKANWPGGHFNPFPFLSDPRSNGSPNGPQDLSSSKDNPKINLNNYASGEIVVGPKETISSWVAVEFKRSAHYENVLITLQNEGDWYTFKGN